MLTRFLRILRVVAGFLIIIGMTGTPRAQAQSLGDLIEQLGIQQLARDYLRPGVDAVGYTLNSAYAHTARVDTGFHVWVGAKAIATSIPEDDRTFVAKLPPELTALGYPSQVTTATVAGGDGAVIRSLTDPSQPEIALPNGTGLDNTLLFMPQISIGSLLGTELILRGLPPVTFDPEVGKISFYGAGLKHELTHYFDSPIQLAIVAGMQQFEITDVVTGTGYAALLLGSVEMQMLTVFGGLGYEAYSIEVSYTAVPPPALGQTAENITLEFRRRNLRFSVGGALSLLSLLDLTAEYSFGEQDNIAVGVGLTF
ncbi:MAG: hypothetical protein JXA28_10350 [Bacteroidetes bacterium]|nr:hypothetical protein [Bacteroidota bacterium]